MIFHQPSVWFLLFLGILPLLWWRWSRRRAGAIVFSSIEPLARVPASWAVRWRGVIPTLRTVAIAILIISLARPQSGDERTRVFTEGIAIELVVDRSGSMLAMDFEIDGRPTSRLEAVKRVVEQFVTGGESLPGRPDDLLGLVSFATFADSVCPVTLDHDHLVQRVRAVNVSAHEEDRATAIGDAVALAVERLRAPGARREPNSSEPDPIKSRVIVLLTDGENTAGDIAPVTAAEMAAAFDIRLYTIGAGTVRGMAPVPIMDPRTGKQAIDPRTGRPLVSHEPVSIDEETLTRMAELTGGAYFRATDRRSLEKVYAQIDQLERTAIEHERFTDYREAAVEPVRLGRVAVPPLLAVAFVLLAAELFLASTRFRRIP